MVIFEHRGETVFREIGCEDGRWIELADDLVQWWILFGISHIDLSVV
jgi:hypothetical protein